MFSWYEGEIENFGAMQSLHVRFYDTSIFHRVERAISKLVDKWAHIFIGGSDMQAVSTDLDINPKLFDFVVSLDHIEDEIISAGFIGE